MKKIVRAKNDMVFAFQIFVLLGIILMSQWLTIV